MRIDVTDLFDDLFAIATIAFTRFGFVSTGKDWEKFVEWDAFCANLSDSFFLALVSNRAYEVTQQKISIEDLKCRIIIRHELGVDGQRGFNLRYEYPVFHHSSKQPCAFAGTLTRNGKSQLYTSLSRPKHSLSLHLGRIPEPEFQTNRTRYDPESRSSKLYYCEHGYETMFSGTVTMFYELQDGWVLREITLGDRLSRHECSSPWFKASECLLMIDVNLFENLWRLSEDENAK